MDSDTGHETRGKTSFKTLLLAMVGQRSFFFSCVSSTSSLSGWLVCVFLCRYPITQRHLHDSRCVKVKNGVRLFNVVRLAPSSLLSSSSFVLCSSSSSPSSLPFLLRMQLKGLLLSFNVDDTRLSGGVYSCTNHCLRQTVLAM